MLYHIACRTQMSCTLPNEILYRISKLVGEESILDLKPFVLVNRQWHAAAAPALAAVISVTSLGKLIELCDQITSYQRDDTTSRSTLAKFTKTIVISGIVDGDADSHLGLDDLGAQPRGQNEGPEEDSIQADIEMEPEIIRSKLHVALSRLVLLSGFEWYGRFAGDYYLVRYLQQSKTIRHLAYGIDRSVSNVSLAYRKHAFAFEGLETVTVTCQYEPSSGLFYAIAQMMHRNPNLRSILFDCNYRIIAAHWSLVDFICDTTLPDQAMFVWQNLSRLVLRFWKGELWQSAEEVELLTRFLVAHPKLETLVLQEIFNGSKRQTAKPLSLLKYPDSLPALKRLLGSPRLIAGVLESQAACSSVERVIDNSEEGFDLKGAKAPYIDRIMDALESVSDNQIQRLRLRIPRLNRNLYARIAQLAPKIRSLDFLCSFEFGSTTPYGSDFNPLVDIPSGLNNFPCLEIIGYHIARDFQIAYEGSGDILELAKQVPRIKAIHGPAGHIDPINRYPNGEVGFAESPRFLDNADYDWVTFDVGWRHRPISQRQFKRLRCLDDSIKLEYQFV
ncbi:unnamed protein product [Rhizoctonia solani]|uniref:Uncharacterized protein n=1 Tax=Rhizoctonia solani TaxID=456999 RepID=A0A8H3BJ09_9AGAM|nr:unnamed protein product [Rhizoctonia solani]